MELSNQLIFVAGALFLLSILASAFTPRLGVPLLLVFLIVGMLAGEDGPGHLQFSDYHLANLAGTAALAVILFDGGMRTPLQNFRVGLRPALSLATIGVLTTTGIVGAFAAHMLKLPMAEGLLIGAIVGSTDAAAVFSLLHTNAVNLNKRVTAALEIESGTNDPMAVLLTLGLLQYLAAPEHYSVLDALWFGARQIVLGLAIGLGGGRLLGMLLNRLDLSDSLYPLLALSGGMLLFGATALLGGSGFLAVYLAGLVMGNRPMRSFSSVRRFHDGVAWLAQIGMFLILGLLATPSRLVPLALPGLAIAAVLIFVARPVAVVLALTPFRFAWREQLYIAWVGLRGSVPMVLATFPVIAGRPHAQLFFDIAFFIVLVSLLVQGWTVAVAARLLGLQMPEDSTRIRRIDLDLPGGAGYEIVSYRISGTSTLVGRKSKALPIPDVSRIVSVSRGGRLLPYREWGVMQRGDYVSLLAAQSELEMLDRVFSERRAGGGRPGDSHFFGEFIIKPDTRAEALAEAYGFDLAPEMKGKTLAGIVQTYLKRPVVGDRLRLGELEVVVRKMDKENVTELGLRMPQASRQKDHDPRG